MRRWVFTLFTVLTIAGCATAQQFTPLRGQTDEQRSRDAAECRAEHRTWGVLAPPFVHAYQLEKEWQCMEERGYRRP